MMTRHILLVLLGFLLCLNLAIASGSVAILTDSNFKETVVDSEQIWLVEFYAPWCGHCKKLQPILDEVSAAIKDPQLKIGKLDSTANKNISKVYDIKAFPTLLYFKEGTTGKYEGARTKEALSSFMVKISSSTVTKILDIKELEPLFVDHPVQFLLTLPKKSPPAVEESFVNVAKKLHFHASFVILRSTTSDPPSVAKYETKRPPRIMTGALTEEAIEFFVKDNNRLFVSAIDSYNFKPLGSLGRVMALALVDYAGAPGATGAVTRALTSAGSALGADGDAFVLGHLDGIKWKRFLKQYEANIVPALLLLDLGGERYFNMDLRATAAEGEGALETAIGDLLRAAAKEEIAYKKFQAKGIVAGILQKLHDYYPWSLFCFAPIVLVVLAVFVFYPDEATKKEKKA